MFYKKARYKKIKFYLPVALFIVGLVVDSIEVYAQPCTTEITINATTTAGPYKPIWAYFGYDEANFTTMKDSKKLLTELAALSPSPI